MPERFKLVQITFHFEYVVQVERLLDDQGVERFARYPMIQGGDTEGKHYGTQVFPGSMTVVQAVVREDAVEALFDSLRAFRREKPAHRHLEAFVLPIERSLGDEEGAG
jgi:hypothetical protein